MKFWPFLEHVYSPWVLFSTYQKSKGNLGFGFLLGHKYGGCVVLPILQARSQLISFQKNLFVTPLWSFKDKFDIIQLHTSYLSFILHRQDSWIPNLYTHKCEPFKMTTNTPIKCKYAVLDIQYIKFCTWENFLHGLRPWCLWQIWGMFSYLYTQSGYCCQQCWPVVMIFQQTKGKLVEFMGEYDL